MNDLFERKAGSTLHLGALHPGTARELVFRALMGPPRREQNAEAGLLQNRRFLRQELVGFAGFEIVASGRGFAQARLDMGTKRRSLPQGRKEILPGIKIQVLQNRCLASPGAPRKLRRNEEARIIRSLEEVVDLPGLSAFRFRFRPRGLFQAKTESERGGDGNRDGPMPVLNLKGKLGKLRPVTLHPRLGGAQGMEPLVVKALECRTFFALCALSRRRRSGFRTGAPHELVHELAQEGRNEGCRRDLRSRGRLRAQCPA